MEEHKKAVGESSVGGAIETWLRKHRLIYVGATRHPFILAVRDGTIDLSSFKRWLVRRLFDTVFVGFASEI